MGIAELQAHHDEYNTLERRVSTMVGNREFPAVFSVCLKSLEHVVPAIKFRKQRGIEPEMPALFSLDAICRYAPPLFEHSVIESSLRFVNTTRILVRHENRYQQAIQAAMDREEIARLVWNRIEQQPGALQRDLGKDLGVHQDTVREIVEVWEQLGVVSRTQHETSYRLEFRSRLDAEVDGVCRACGVRGRGRKEAFLKPIRCQKCGSESYYHIRCTDLD